MPRPPEPRGSLNSRSAPQRLEGVDSATSGREAQLKWVADVDLCGVTAWWHFSSPTLCSRTLLGSPPVSMFVCIHENMNISCWIHQSIVVIGWVPEQLTDVVLFFLPSVLFRKWAYRVSVSCAGQAIALHLSFQQAKKVFFKPVSWLGSSVVVGMV